MIKKLMILAKEKGVTYLKINEETIKQLSIEVFNQDIEKYEVSSLTTYIITGEYNNKLITICTEDITNPSNIVEEIITNSNIIDIEEKRPQNKQESIIYKHEYHLDSPQTIINKMIKLNDYKQKYPQIKDINTTYNEQIKQIIITDSDDMHLEDIIKTYCFSVEAIAKNENLVSSFDNFIQTITPITNINELTEQVIEKAIRKLNCSTFPSKKYHVILENRVASIILGEFIHLFSAEKIQAKISLLTNKLNTKVFSDKVTIVEDPTNEKLIGKRLFDKEGTKTYYKEIVKDGVFKTILYDNKTAQQDNTTSTGNSYNTITGRNMTLLPKNKTMCDLISMEKDAILIDGIQGYHAGINKTTGAISLQAEGYTIINGKINAPIKLFALVTNIFELLNNIIEIGNDLKNNNQTFNSPSLLIENITISK